ncbi:MAG TPA: TonB-dependent receptor [Cyclobacteriaceae bacterium]|nr:TonB-dependent receptor [Cyclobacteriaceae bacterium]
MKSILFYTMLLMSLAASAQVLELKLDGSEQGKSLTTVLGEIERKTNARFYFLPEWISPITFQQSYVGQTLGDAIDNLFLGTDLNYFAMYPNSLVIVKDATQLMLRKSAIQNAIRQNKTIERHVFGEPGKSTKSRIVISGRVLDSKTSEPLPGTNIQVSDTQYGTTTDDQGIYSLSLAPGLYVLNFSFLDYENKVIDLAAYADGEINLDMDKMPFMLDEIVIQDRAENELTSRKIGEVQLTMGNMKRAPALMGEVDLIKQVQNLPGVTTVGEAAAGFNVRGGSVDQNLILYDGLPVFNSSHVFGFLSSFNPEAVRDVSFYRGGIPAEYGGRASSVLDIHAKDGSFETWNGNAGIGLITSNLMINGPLQKDKTSLLASFRSTYSDWLVHSIRTDYVDLTNSSVFFYDGTLKLTHIINERTRLSFTGYSSKDKFRLMGDSTYQWNNLQGSARLDHQISARLSSEFIAGISSYGYSVLNKEALTASELSFRILSTVLKAGFNYQHGNHKINFGWQLLHYQFDPGSLKPTSPESNAKLFSVDKQYSIENALYVADDWSINQKVFVDAGIRLPIFSSYGPASVNVYKENLPRDLANVVDTLHFSKGETIKTYVGLEPRLSFRWTPNLTSSLKLGYSRVYQFLQLVTNSTAVTPVDIWQPSGYYFKPQQADQVSLGYFKDFKQKKYGASAEVFYKATQNILDFKDGAQLILNTHLETDLLQGKGQAYGVETFLSKNTGRFTWSMNYTFARTFRLIAGPTRSESINKGQQYPANFDQPHIANVSWKYNLSRRHFFTGNFTYHTGRPVTIPLSAFAIENTTVAYFSDRNQYRIPDYHRLDLALVIEGNHKRKKIGSGTWVISVYNVYARKNPYSVFFKSTGGGLPKPYQLSIIGTAFPSISYNFKF